MKKKEGLKNGVGTRWHGIHFSEVSGHLGYIAMVEGLNGGGILLHHFITSGVIVDQ